MDATRLLYRVLISYMRRACYVRRYTCIQRRPVTTAKITATVVASDCGKLYVCCCGCCRALVLRLMTMMMMTWNLMCSSYVRVCAWRDCGWIKELSQNKQWRHTATTYSDTHTHRVEEREAEREGRRRKGRERERHRKRSAPISMSSAESLYTAF